MWPSKTVEAPRFELGTSGPRLFPSVSPEEQIELIHYRLPS